MKRGGTRKGVRYRYKQGGEEMNPGMILLALEAANVVLNILDDDRDDR